MSSNIQHKCTILAQWYFAVTGIITSSYSVISSKGPISMALYNMYFNVTSGGSRGAPPPLATKFFSISCTFQENLIKLYPGAPLGVGAPWENPGSATGYNPSNNIRARAPTCWGLPLRLEPSEMHHFPFYVLPWQKCLWSNCKENIE